MAGPSRPNHHYCVSTHFLYHHYDTSKSAWQLAALLPIYWALQEAAIFCAFPRNRKAQLSLAYAIVKPLPWWEGDAAADHVPLGA
jgi:hypothetical protein